MNRLVDACYPVIVALAVAFAWWHTYANLGYSSDVASATAAFTGYVCVPVMFVLTLAVLLIIEPAISESFDRKILVSFATAANAGSAALAAYATLASMDWAARSSILVASALVVALSAAAISGETARMQSAEEPWFVRKMLLPAGVYFGAVLASGSSGIVVGATIFALFVGVQLLWTLLRRAN